MLALRFNLNDILDIKRKILFREIKKRILFCFGITGTE